MSETGPQEDVDEHESATRRSGAEAVGVTTEGKKVEVWMHRDLKKRAEHRAVDHEMSLAGYIRFLIEQDASTGSVGN